MLDSFFTDKETQGNRCGSTKSCRNSEPQEGFRKIKTKMTPIFEIGKS